MGIQINGNTNNINAGIGSLSIEDINELDIVGVVTAANFKTGVSNLHNVGLTLSGGQIDVGSNIKIGTAGVVTATSFVGSGANLTGITQTTINSNAANRIITGSGSANTLEGNSNFTYTGSVVTHNNPSGLAKLDVKGSVAGGALGASISVRNTNSANNGSGEFQFQDPGSNIFAKIAGINLTDGSNNGYMTFHTASATSGLVERLRIDSSGRVLIGTTTEGNAAADDLTISGSGEIGMTIRSTNSSQCNLFFSDGTSGAAEYAGVIRYDHATNSMRVWTNGDSEKLRIDSSGRVMIGDTNTNNAFSGGDSLVIGNTPSGTRSGITLVSNSSTDGGIYFSTGSSNQTMGQIVYNHPDNSLRFYANNSQRLRIKSDGSVAIAGDNVNISTDTAHTVDRNEKVAIKNRYVDASATEINLDTSGNLGQSLNLVSHSSSTNNFAMLTFDSGSLKSGIAGGRPNAGNWGTDLRFYTHPNATSNVHKTYERMRIDNEGAISLKYGRVNDAGHQIYRYGGFVAGTATVSVNIPVLNQGNIYWIEAFYTHHSLSYGGYLYGVYGAYSGHNGLQINNTFGSSTAGGTNVGTWSVTRGNSGQPIVVAKSAGSYGGQGHWWVHVHAGTTPNL